MTMEEMRAMEKRLNKAQDLIVQRVALQSAINKLEEYIQDIDKGANNQDEFKRSNALIISSMDHILGKTLDGVEISPYMRRAVTSYAIAVMKDELDKVNTEYDTL